MTKPERRRLPKKLFVAFSALVLSLCAAELVVRRVFPVGSLLFGLDETLHYAPIPGARNITLMDEAVGGARILVEINEAGFRGRPLAPRPPAGDPARLMRPNRIAVYGDSLVLAENVTLEHTFVERLGAYTATGLGTDVEVVNAGVTGYGPDQACLKLERELDALDPDLVVFVLCASNDFGDLLRNKLFRIDEDGQLAPAPHVLIDAVRDSFAERERAAHRPALLRAFEHFVASVRREEAPETEPGPPPYMQWYLAASREEFQYADDPEVHNLFQDTYDADIAIHPEWPSAGLKRSLMGAVLGRVRLGCESRGVPLLAVVVPSAVDLDPGFKIRVDKRKWPSYVPSRLTDELAALLAEREIEYVDLFEPFREADPAELFVGVDDIHWNEAGQDLAARLSAAAIEARELLE
jgi:lysophospholipase L1-like esterase